MADPLIGTHLDEDRTTADATLSFYERKADAYFRSTFENDLKDLYRLHLEGLPGGGLMLDAGRGSGRGSLALLPEKMTGIRVDIARFVT